MMEEKKMDSYKKDFEVVMFFSSQNIDFPFLFEEILEAFLFLSLFPIFLSFFMLCLFDDSGILMILEEKDCIRKFFSNGMG
jgi:hypothetical protein